MTPLTVETTAGHTVHIWNESLASWMPSGSIKWPVESMSRGYAPVCLVCPERSRDRLGTHIGCPVCKGMGQGPHPTGPQAEGIAEEPRKARNATIARNLWRRHRKRQAVAAMTEPTTTERLASNVAAPAPEQETEDMDTERIIKGDEPAKWYRTDCEHCDTQFTNRRFDSDILPKLKRRGVLRRKQFCQKCPKCGSEFWYPEHPTQDEIDRYIRPRVRHGAPFVTRIKRLALFGAASFTAGHYFWDDAAVWVGRAVTFVMSVL